MDVLSGVLAIIIAPIVRSASGWLENALEDGMIDKFEWSELGATVVRVGMMTGAAYFGFQFAGIDINAVAAAAGAYVADLILYAIKYRGANQ